MSGRRAVGIIFGGVLVVILISAAIYLLVRGGQVAPPPEDDPGIRIELPVLPGQPVLVRLESAVLPASLADA